MTIEKKELFNILDEIYDYFRDKAQDWPECPEYNDLADNVITIMQVIERFAPDKFDMQ